MDHLHKNWAVRMANCTNTNSLPLNDEVDTKAAELHACVQHNDLDGLRRLVASGIDINCTHSGRTALSLAAQLGNLSAVEILLATGECRLAAADRCDGVWQRQAVHHAAGQGHEAVVKRLLAGGASVNASDADQRTPLHWAATSGNVRVADLLLTCGAAVNIVQRDGFAPLHGATCLGDTLMCECLLAAGACVNRADRDGWTPLHMAAAYDYAVLVSLFVAAGARVDQRNSEGQTALHVAVERADVALLDLLLAHGASLDARTRTGTTPLLHAVARDRSVVVAYLLDMGADPSTRDHTGRSPIHLACIRSLPALLHLLIAAGANLTSESWLDNSQGSPPALLVGDSCLAAWLRRQAKQPRSLQMTTRIFIRRCLAPRIQAKVALLPIPAPLQRYIALLSGLDPSSNLS